MKKLILFLLCLLCAVIVGCNSIMTVYEFADDGKTIKKKIVTDESMIKSIMEEMKNKNVAWGTNGWGGELEATFFGTETYVPTAKIRIFNANRWHISFTGNTDPAPALKAIMGTGVEADVKLTGATIGNK